MNNFIRWASNNPTKTWPYRFLLDEKADYEKQLATYRERLAQAQAGIAPPRHGGYMVSEKWADLFDPILSFQYEQSYSKIEREKAKADREREKAEREKRELQTRIEAELEVNPERIARKLEDIAEIDKQLDDFKLPSKYTSNWREAIKQYWDSENPVDRKELYAKSRYRNAYMGDDENLFEFLNARLRSLYTSRAVFEYSHVASSLNWFVQQSDNISGYSIRRIDEFLYYATIHTSKGAFTRCNSLLEGAVCYAFLTALDAVWDDLVSEFDYLMADNRVA